MSTTGKDGNPIEGAKCKLSNDRGTWEAKPPAFVDVRRSAEDLNVVCKQEGQPNGLVKAISRAAGGMMGNIILESPAAAKIAFAAAPRSLGLFNIPVKAELVYFALTKYVVKGRS